MLTLRESRVVQLEMTNDYEVTSQVEDNSVGTLTTEFAVSDGDGCFDPDHSSETTGMSNFQKLETFFIGTCLEGFFWGTMIVCSDFRGPLLTQFDITFAQESTLPYSPYIYNTTNRKKLEATRRKKSFSIVTVLCMFCLVLPLPSILHG